MSWYARELLWPLFKDICNDDAEWQHLNDQYEFRRALLFAHAEMQIPPMLAGGERRWSSSGWQPEVDFLTEVDIRAANTPWANYGIDPKHFELVRSSARRNMSATRR